VVFATQGRKKERKKERQKERKEEKKWRARIGAANDVVNILGTIHNILVEGNNES